MKPDTEEQKRLQKRARDLGLGDFEKLSEESKRELEKGADLDNYSIGKSVSLIGNNQKYIITSVNRRTRQITYM